MTPTIDSIICFSPDGWGDVRRPQQLMRRFASRAPVLYVEPALSLASVVKRSTSVMDAAGRSRLHRALTGAVEELEDGVHVITPLVPVPEHRLSRFVPNAMLDSSSAAMRRAVSRRVHRASRSLGLAAPVLWFGYPIVLPEVSAVQPTMVVYDCVDRWSDFPGPLADTWWREQLIADERQLVNASDVVFCSAEGLLESREAEASGRAVLLRNGADVEHFAATGRPTPSEMAELPRPVVGFVGAIADWVDLDLIRQTAILRRDWSFVLVGPAYHGALLGDPERLEVLRGLPNVHLLGQRSYDDVPAYLEAFDVALIPFKLNGLTDDVNPIKLYEYLAAGVPVVATPIPECCGMSGVRVADEPHGFVREIEAALDERPDERLRRERVSVACANSWDARVGAAWETMAARSPQHLRAARQPTPKLVAEVGGRA